jgi:HK97 family phage portal protein
MALTEFGALTFGQGTNPAGIITHPSRLKEESEKNLRKSLDKYKGLGNSHRLMLLEEGMKFDRIGLPPEDAQYIESRKFTIAEIARIYNVPLHLLQDHEKATSWGSGIEELNLGFVTFTLRPYLVQWEQEIHKKLFFNSKKYFAEFLIEGLLRGKLSERYNSYQIGRTGGWLSANDVRTLENMNPLPDIEGNTYLVPLNMKDASKINEEPVEGVETTKEPV